MRSILTVVLLGGLLGVSDGANATTVRGFTTAAMVTEAAVVIRGRVESRKSLWSADKSKIYTDSVVTVVEVLAGTARPKTVVVRQLGGTVEGTQMHVEGIAPLSIGEDVVLFLRTDGARWFTVGMAQGKFSVQRDKAGTEIVTREIAGLARVQVGRRVSFHRPSPSWEEPPQTYSSFSAQIRAWGKERSR